MPQTRRSFLALGAAGLVSAARPVLAHRLVAQAPAFKLGITDWNLRKEANPESFALGKRLGFDGVQVSLASGRGKDRAPISSEVDRKSTRLNSSH